MFGKLHRTKFNIQNGIKKLKNKRYLDPETSSG